ncbi:hypothetical protein [Flavobacterium ardleyense]|uniref:hypothetical protein n=1 Tax=Flavobacterium ardleyense TaxID=2038737 RepID=UPI00298C4FF8|nr:hypothetical protein [Flavobacterium ardleyense]
MHTISSKFRDLFIGKIVFLAFVFTVILTFSLKYILKLKEVDSQITVNLIVGLAIVLSWLLIYRIVAVMKVNIVEDRIEIFSLFGKKTEIFCIDIVKIESEKVVLTSKAGNITDGFHISILLLKNGKHIIISPDEFENYNEIMAAVISRRNSKSVSKRNA